jgi:hypothetical protein
MKILIFVLISMFIASANYSQDHNNCFDYLDLPTYSDNGVTYEKVSDSTNFFRLYNDNIIFKIGKKYLYSIDIEKNSKNYYFDYSDITETSTDSSYAFLLYSIDTVKNSFYLNYHDQSPYFVKYYNSKLNSLGYEYTGCIENKTNFWIHPFYTNRFRATYRLPWPFFVNSKNQIGNKYSWEHKIPDFYSFAEISPFKGVKNLDFEYEIINIFSKKWN